METEQFNLSNEQQHVVEVLVRLIGMYDVRRLPEQGDSIVLDLLPAEHVIDNLDGDRPSPFCVRINPEGHIRIISAEEAGIGERPTELEAFAAKVAENNKRLRHIIENHRKLRDDET